MTYAELIEALELAHAIVMLRRADRQDHPKFKREPYVLALKGITHALKEARYHQENNKGGK